MNDGRGLNPGSMCKNRVSNLGRLKKFFGIEILGKKRVHLQQMFGKVVAFTLKHAKHVWINDHM